MAEIKWTNVDGAALNGAVSNSQSAVNAFTTQLNQLGSNTKDFTTELQQRADETAEWNRSQNTQRIVNQMLNADSLEALQQMQAEGVGDAQTALSQYGGQIDLAALNKSKATWVADTQNRALAKDSLRDYTDIAQKRRAEILNLANNGGEAEALKLLNASGDIFSNKTLGELQATISGRIDANRKFLLDSRLATVQEKNADVNEMKIRADNAYTEAQTQSVKLTTAQTAATKAEEYALKSAKIKSGLNQVNLDQTEARNRYAMLVQNTTKNLMGEAYKLAQEKNVMSAYRELADALANQDFSRFNSLLSKFNNLTNGRLTISGDEMKVLQKAASDLQTSEKKFAKTKSDLLGEAEGLQAGQEALELNTPDNIEVNQRVSRSDSAKAQQDLLGNSGSNQGSYTKEVTKQENKSQKISSDVNGIGVSGNTNQSDNTHSKTEVTQTSTGTNQQDTTNTTGSENTNTSTSTSVSVERTKSNFEASNKILKDIENSKGGDAVTPNDITARVLSNIADLTNGYKKLPNTNMSDYRKGLNETHSVLLAGWQQAKDRGDTALINQYETELAVISNNIREAEDSENAYEVEKAKGTPSSPQDVISAVESGNLEQMLDNEDKIVKEQNITNKDGEDSANTYENDAINVEKLYATVAKFKSTQDITNAKVDALERSKAAPTLEEQEEAYEEYKYLTFLEHYSKENKLVPIPELAKKFFDDYSADVKALNNNKAEEVVNILAVGSNNMAKELVKNVATDKFNKAKNIKEADEQEAKKKLELTVPKNATNGSDTFVVNPKDNLKNQLGSFINPKAIGTSKWFSKEAKLSKIEEMAQKIDAMATDPEKRELVIYYREMYAKKLMPILEQLSDTSASSDGDKRYESAIDNLNKLNTDFDVLLNTTSNLTMKRIEESVNRVDTRFGNASSVTNVIDNYIRAAQEKQKDIESNNGNGSVTLSERATKHFRKGVDAGYGNKSDEYNLSESYKPFRQAQEQLAEDSNRGIRTLSKISENRLKEIDQKLYDPSVDISTIRALEKEKLEIKAAIAEELPKMNVKAFDKEITLLESLIKKGINVEEAKERIEKLKANKARYDKLMAESGEAHRQLRSGQ